MSQIFNEQITYEEIALEGASLIDEYFFGCAQNVLIWSRWDAAEDTVLVYGDLYDAHDQQELFKRLLRHHFGLAGFRELSYVEYFDGGHDPIWVMLVRVYPAADLPVGVDLCRWASFGWPLKRYLRLRRYPKRRLNPTLKLLVPGYPDVDGTRPLDQLMLESQAASARALRPTDDLTTDEWSC